MGKVRFALIFTVLSLLSCHKDDTKFPITGKWFMTSVTSKFYQEDKLVSDKNYPLTGTGYYEFLSNDSLNSEDDYGNMGFTTYSYNADNGKLTTQDGDEFIVTRLTSSQLILQQVVLFDDSVQSKSVIDRYFKK